MPSTVCAVVTCRNYYSKTRNNGVSYHRFPRCQNLLNSWLAACKQPGGFCPDQSTVCSKHFKDEDFERDLKNELLGLPQKKILKPDAIPTQNLPDSQERTEETGRRYSRKNKRKESNVLSNSSTNDDAEIGATKTPLRTAVHTNELLMRISQLEDENFRLRKETYVLPHDIETVLLDSTSNEDAKIEVTNTPPHVNELLRRISQLEHENSELKKETYVLPHDIETVTGTKLQSASLKQRRLEEEVQKLKRQAKSINKNKIQYARDVLNEVFAPGLDGMQTYDVDFSRNGISNSTGLFRKRHIHS